MNPQHWLEEIQNKPYRTRVRILWFTVAIILAILVVAISYSIKSTVGKFNGEDLLNNANPSQSNPTREVAMVEYVEQTSSGVKIYFNIKNNTSDILNFSKLEDVGLEADGQTYSPKQILDRQGEPFVAKILSHTQNFGILVFDPVQGDEASLVFRNMFLEQAPTEFFQQQLELNFKELNESNKPRT